MRGGGQNGDEFPCRVERARKSKRGACPHIKEMALLQETHPIPKEHGLGQGPRDNRMG